MAKGIPPQKPSKVVKTFTPIEIDRAIGKLRKRAAEVKALEDQNVAYNDQKVKNAEHNIREMIREVFGSESPEFGDHEYHDIWHGGYNVGDDDEDRQAKFRAGIMQTVTLLEGLIDRLEEKRGDISIDPTSRTQAAFSDMQIHSRIAAVCSELYRDGHYGNAVFDASKALINFVKERSGRHDLDGAPLMRTVFSRTGPILAFNDLSNQTDLDEQEGMMHLFEGAVLAIRNPRGHSFFDDSPERALEYISLLSMLANRLEEARRLK